MYILNEKLYKTSYVTTKVNIFFWKKKLEPSSFLYRIEIRKVTKANRPRKTCLWIFQINTADIKTEYQSRIFFHPTHWSHGEFEENTRRPPSFVPLENEVSPLTRAVIRCRHLNTPFMRQIKVLTRFVSENGKRPFEREFPTRENGCAKWAKFRAQCENDALPNLPCLMASRVHSKSPRIRSILHCSKCTIR